MTNKAKNFSFDTEEKDIFANQPKGKRNVGGRPTKKDEEKLSIQKTIKFTTEENEALIRDFERAKTQFTSFASYLRYLIFSGKRNIQ
jgi:hypothetical protein